MINIIDTYSEIPALFENGCFDFDKWKTYINSIYDDCAGIFIEDMQECLDTGLYTYEEHYLPVLNAVHRHPKQDIMYRSFKTAIDGLDQKIANVFGREVNTDIVLYLGLCNGAGCATEINGRAVLLLGVEKILELDWTDETAMKGLIYHELGHLYQQQYGILERETSDNRQKFIWQLFTEGIAMFFEQQVVGDLNFYHQNIDGWKDWCDEHFDHIKTDFDRDLDTMTFETQRYFGDWVSYCGKGDVGYYLGARFIQHLSAQGHTFDDMINYDIEQVCRLYEEYIRS